MGSIESPTGDSEGRLPWQVIAERKRSERDNMISSWAKKTIGSETPRLPSNTAVSVREWPAQSGHLTPRQIEITSTVPSQILQKIATGVWTAEEVFIAFSTCAVIAHHLTNPFSEVFFRTGLQRARELDEYRGRTGHVVGPLHGLPFSLKDVMNLEGHATTLGFVALVDNVASSSDELVARLHDAGAVFFCKTNVPQSLMSGECNNWVFGRTSTPDNRNLSAGGSSGGEGSLIALRGSPLGIGTDIAGSIRTPANFNGIYGLCPTYGRLPCHSAQYSSLGLINGVAGPMSSSLDGLELYTLTVLSFEPWKWDATCVPLPWNSKTYSETRRLASSGNFSFGFVCHDGIVRPDPPIERGLKETRQALINAGHQVVDVDLFRSDDELWPTALGIFCSDGGQSLRDTLAIVPEPPVREILIPDGSMALSSSEMDSESKKLLRIRERFLQRWQDTARMTQTGRPVDIFVLPSGGHVAPPHGSMEYFLYEAISNILNWTCATFPVGRVDAVLDPKPDLSVQFVPMSEDDRKNRAKYSPEFYENGPVCLQIMGPPYSEELVLASMRVIADALGREPNALL